MGSGVVKTRSAYDPILANEIVARISEGEMLSSITADPRLPCLATVRRWAAANPEFGEEMRLAREALAERLSDLGWKMALEATPETAYLTQVRLGQLRWTAAVLGPRTHGRMKPVEAPAAVERLDICYRDFQLETDPETGRRRVVSYVADPETMQPVRHSVGPWTDPVDPVAKAAELQRLIDEGRARPAGSEGEDPEGWR